MTSCGFIYSWALGTALFTFSLQFCSDGFALSLKEKGKCMPTEYKGSVTVTMWSLHISTKRERAIRENTGRTSARMT